MSHAPHMIKSRPPYERVMPHIWMSHAPVHPSSISAAPHMNESRPSYEWVMPHIWMSHVPVHPSSISAAFGSWLLHMCVTWLLHMCDMTPSYVCHDSFICVTWLIYTCDAFGSCVCRTYELVMSHAYVWLLRHIHMSNWIDIFMRVTEMTSSCVWLRWRGEIYVTHLCEDTQMNSVTHISHRLMCRTWLTDLYVCYTTYVCETLRVCHELMTCVF